MTTCSYCDKDLNRHNFCNDSHRVMFNRKNKKSTGSPNVTRAESPTTTPKGVSAPTFSYVMGSEFKQTEKEEPEELGRCQYQDWAGNKCNKDAVGFADFEVSDGYRSLAVCEKHTPKES